MLMQHLYDYLMVRESLIANFVLQFERFEGYPGLLRRSLIEPKMADLEQGSKDAPDRVGDVGPNFFSRVFSLFSFLLSISDCHPFE